MNNPFLLSGFEVGLFGPKVFGALGITKAASSSVSFFQICGV